MILHLGNKLHNKGFTPTCVDVLGSKLAPHFVWKSFSDKRNPVIRILNCLLNIWVFRKKAKLCLIDTYSTQNFWMAYILAKMCQGLKIPYIPILHGGKLPERYASHPKNLCSYLRNAEEIVSPSHYLKTFFEAKGFSSRYIPNTIELAAYDFKQRENAAPKLFYLRALHEIYHPEMAIRVLKALLSKYPKASLCMVGPDKDGSLEKCMHLAKELDIENHVQFMGRLDLAEWLLLSRDYDVFINTTNYDNLPVSVIEAMALGFPIVSTNAGGIPYLISEGEDGLMVEKGDVAGMVKAIIRVLEDPDLCKKTSAQARMKALEFSWDRVEVQWMNLLKAYVV